MYNDWYKWEKCEINGKTYTVNYIVKCIVNVMGVNFQFAHFLFNDRYTDNEIADIIQRYKAGERWKNKVRHIELAETRE